MLESMVNQLVESDNHSILMYLLWEKYKNVIKHKLLSNIHLVYFSVMGHDLLKRYTNLPLRSVPATEKMPTNKIKSRILL